MISTHRLTIRPFQQSDVDQLGAVLKRPKSYGVQRLWYTNHAPLRDWLQRSLQTVDLELPLTLAICLKSDGQLIGYISLSNDPQRVSRGEAEIGWRLAYANWGFGFVPEAAEAMTAHATCLSETKRIVVFVDPNDRQSVCVLQKIGMTYERDVMFESYDDPDQRFSLELSAAAR